MQNVAESFGVGSKFKRAVKRKCRAAFARSGDNTEPNLPSICGLLSPVIKTSQVFVFLTL